MPSSLTPKHPTSAPEAEPHETPLLLSVLGPMSARHDGHDLPLGPPRRRALLALLLIRLGRVVPTELLIEELWGEEPPRQSVATLQSHISHLRRVLQPASGPDRPTVLRHRAHGYVLELAPEQIDACRFERLVAEGRLLLERRDPRAARDRFTAALSLWRGSPYAEFDGHPPLSDESSRLEDVRLTAVESCAEAQLALGEAQEVAADLDREARLHPARERLVGHLMTALSRLGRQAEALEAYERTRVHLEEEFGVGTAAELRRVRTAILRQEPGAGGPTAGLMTGSVTGSLTGPLTRPAAGPRPGSPGPAGPALPATALGGATENDGEGTQGAEERPPCAAQEPERPTAAEAFGGIGGGTAAPDERSAAEEAGTTGTQADGPARGPGHAHRPTTITAYSQPTTTPPTTTPTRPATENSRSTHNNSRSTTESWQSTTENWPSPTENWQPPSKNWQSPTANADEHPRPTPPDAKTPEYDPNTESSRPVCGSPGAQSPFTGRSEELQRLTAAAASALAGHGHVAGVLGPAGVGKTRLLLEFALRLGTPQAGRKGADEDASGLEVIWSHCFLGEGVPPYWVWTQILRRLSTTRPDAFRAAAEPFGTLLAPLLPERADRPGGPAPESDWGRARFLTHDAVCEVLLALAAQRPLVLLMEDLHWADTASLDLLRLLSTRSQGHPLGIVLTAREYEIESDATLRRMLSEVLRGPRTETLRLGGLSRHAVAALVGPGVDARVVEVLHRRSEGNPYFVMQLLSLLGDARSLRRPDAVDVLLTRVPTGVREALHQRFATLPDTVLRVLRLCAVIGTEIDTDLLERTATEDEPVTKALELAIRAGLLGEDRHHPERLHFTHALVQETLIDELAREDRQRLHARVVEGISTRRLGQLADEEIERIAHHAWHAKSALPAADTLPLLLRAAEQAEQQLAYEQVETWLRRAVHLVGLLPPGDPSAASLNQRLHIQLGQVLATTRGYGHAEAETALARGWALSAAARSPEDPSVLWALCAAYIVTGRYDASRQFSHLLRDLADGTGQPVAVLGAAYGEGIVLHVRGQLRQALAELEHGVAMADGYANEGHSLARTFQHDPRVSCRSYDTFTRWLLGDRTTATARRRELLRLTEYDSRPSDRCFALYVDAVVAAWEDDARTARSSGAEGVRLADEHGLLYWKGMLGVLEGWGRTHCGQEDGLTLMHSSLAELRNSRTYLRRPLHLGLLAQAQHHAGRTEDAKTTFRALLAAVGQSNEHVYLHPDLPATRLLHDLLGRGAAESVATG
ncbi:AAA family ATPase [Streptomyces sp. RPA4-5]|uniref:BTAD domain-containing putative transcriptional regulator n=1 Tax=Streptomyces TaxID=1883 RepID=UPI00143E57EB|nr:MULTISPECIES: BTAD domain-containing putative transcriptional regulator [Streptomyces]MCX4637557.1 AAA family ATPase [Streptomyces platensis]QIY53752.1 AAA family ATPase [Streptomyces sp. RPA4-5]WJY36297.1 BTAD domain-containing putative transcriptional regulator [Streptomyces sp. P9-2B-2]